jgi:hypothetical protein
LQVSASELNSCNRRPVLCWMAFSSLCVSARRKLSVRSVRIHMNKFNFTRCGREESENEAHTCKFCHGIWVSHDRDYVGVDLVCCNSVCGLVGRSQCFGETYCLYCQGSVRFLERLYLPTIPHNGTTQNNNNNVIFVTHDLLVSIHLWCTSQWYVWTEVPGSIPGHSLGFFWGSWVWNWVHSASWSDKLSSYLNKEVTVRFGKLKMQLWDSMCWPHDNPVPSGAVGKDCQWRLLSRLRFVRACSATDVWIE